MLHSTQGMTTTERYQVIISQVDRLKHLYRQTGCKVIRQQARILREETRSFINEELRKEESNYKLKFIVL